MLSAEEVPLLGIGPAGSRLVVRQSVHVRAHLLQQGLPERDLEMPSPPTLSVLGVKRKGM